MAVVVFALKAYLVMVICVLVVYSIRHFIFTVNRVSAEQRLFYQDIIDSDLPSVSVLIPMHNEEKVARQGIEAVLRSDYPSDRFEIIPINDHSSDGTGDLLMQISRDHKNVKPLHRNNGKRGKPEGLNDALRVAGGDIVIVFDADYIPGVGTLRDLAVSFKDPEVGAVMGRVVPMNTNESLLARILELERSGGYQVDQQARYNLSLIPQYGGTVGGFRKELMLALGGFDPKVLAEDTDLTCRLVINGWKVVYANRVECYEEVPETWEVRSRQIRRWARGHNQTMLKNFLPLLKSPYLSLREKVDGALLLLIYLIPVFLLLGIADSIALFFLGEMEIYHSLVIFILVAGYNAFGNFAPFYQIGTAYLLDGVTYRICLLPFLLFYFLLNLWNTGLGLTDALADSVSRRERKWAKTRRFRERSTP
jgi:cellulose synthase/poly-beta-1,6-N-acetylglucosamine synthase-like glycosyltransferase